MSKTRKMCLTRALLLSSNPNCRPPQDIPWTACSSGQLKTDTYQKITTPHHPAWQGNPPPAPMALLSEASTVDASGQIGALRRRPSFILKAKIARQYSDFSTSARIVSLRHPFHLMHYVKKNFRGERSQLGK